MAVLVANQVKHWSGITINFAGNHAKYFYEIIKFKQLDWDIMDFDNTNICMDQVIKNKFE